MALNKRTLLLIVSLLLAVSVSVFGTVAYLTSSAGATNTFTVGDVQIDLDETDVDEDGNPKYPVDTDDDGEPDREIIIDDDDNIIIIDPTIEDDPETPEDESIIDVIEPEGYDPEGNPIYPDDTDVDGDGDPDKIIVDDDDNIVLNPGEDDEQIIPPGKDDENEYNIVPGVEYLKDPTVTVLKNSEEAYVRMQVEITNYAAVKAALGVADDEILPMLAPDLNTTDWQLNAVTVDGDVLKHEFRYKETVEAGTTDVELPALFETFTVPGTLDRDQLQAIAGMKMNVLGQAIQAATFDNADDAWKAFGEQVGD